MTITRIIVLQRRYGPDLVTLQTDLPEAAWPFTNRLFLDFHAARGTGHDFVKKNFPEVQDVVFHHVT